MKKTKDGSGKVSQRLFNTVLRRRMRNNSESKADHKPLSKKKSHDGLPSLKFVIAFVVTALILVVFLSFFEMAFAVFLVAIIGTGVVGS